MSETPSLSAVAAARRRREAIVVVVLLAAGVLCAAGLASGYGQSWDDPGDAAYGQTVLRAYLGSHAYLQGGDRRFYGPLYFMFAGGMSQVFARIVPAWSAVDIRHFLNFTVFLVGLAAFYHLARRLIGFGPAVVTTLLFAFQPVFFGHAFINQKDIPFLSGFLLTIALGVRAAESKPDDNGVPLGLALKKGWRLSSPARRAIFVLATGAGLLLAADLIVGGFVEGRGQILLAQAYRGQAFVPVQAIFALLARDAYKTPLADYAEKLHGIFGWLRLIGAYLAALPALLLGRQMARRGGARGYRHLTRATLPAALALGASLSIRIAAAFAGALVSLLLLWRKGRRSTLDLIGYWVVALSLCYLTWPFLWGAPLKNALQAVRMTAAFTSHPVLFRGTELSSWKLPWDYLPTLLSVQLTETALILIALGLVALIPRWRSSPRRDLLVLLLAWFLVPFLASVVGRVPLYSNFRQVLFALPPLFLLAGLAIDFGWLRWRSPFVRSALAALILLPGVVAIVQLRPYEYIYYNSLTGGVKGAEGLYEHDYWCTSYREAMAYVNARAAEGARVAIAEPYDAAAGFARRDLVLVRSSRDAQAAYALRCNNRGDLTLHNLEGFPVGYVVARKGVVLSVVFEANRPSLPAEPRRSLSRARSLGRAVTVANR